MLPYLVFYIDLLTLAQIKEDRKAIKAFRKARPPTFDGSNLERLSEWTHEISNLLEVCHCPRCIHTNLVTMQLKGFTLSWWIQQSKQRIKVSYVEERSNGSLLLSS